MFIKYVKFLLLSVCLSLSAAANAQSGSESSKNNTGERPVYQAAPVPHWVPAYTYPAPNYHRPYYPVDRQRFSNRSSQRFNGRNDWFGDNRMNHWNRVVSDMVSDMFGDGTGDFDFDVNIKFKAKGKGSGRGKAHGKGYADGSSTRYLQGTGNAYGQGYARQRSGWNGYNFNHYYPPYTGYYPYQGGGRQAPVTYPSYPPVAPAKKVPDVSKDKDSSTQ